VFRRNVGCIKPVIEVRDQAYAHDRVDYLVPSFMLVGLAEEDLIERLGEHYRQH